MAGCGEVAPGEPLPRVVIVGETGPSPGQFLKPRAMDVDSRSVWVVDKTARIQRLDPETGDPLSVWSTPESAIGKPVGLTVVERAVDADGSVIATPERPLVFVADTHYHRVLIYRAPAPNREAPEAEAPELVGEFGSYGRGPGEFIYTTDVAVLQDADGRIERLYVSEYGGNDRVQIFDGAHGYLGEVGRFGPGDDPGAVEFNRPQSLDLDVRGRGGRGELLVTDAGNHRVGRLSLEGELLGWIDGDDGEGALGEVGPMRYPYGVLALGDGTALVAEFGRNQVRRVDIESGATVGAWGRVGRDEGELMTPWAVAARDRQVYVLDTGHNRVQMFDAGVRVRSGR